MDPVQDESFVSGVKRGRTRSRENNEPARCSEDQVGALRNLPRSWQPRTEGLMPSQNRDEEVLEQSPQGDSLLQTEGPMPPSGQSRVAGSGLESNQQGRSLWKRPLVMSWSSS